ncbi:hypothetical protein C8Q80DRAFT_1291364 [Daedaleopsis nitida]|nr:hypothetical protein C8Q80DRAFT_1291364 [Daedaleopsis nitida]
MSSLPDPNEVEELTALYNTMWINSYCDLAASAFFVYEFTILLGNEIEYFWKRRITGASILFLLGKYLPLAYSLIKLALYLPQAVFTDNAESLVHLHTGSLPRGNYIKLMPLAAFSALRAFVLSRSRVWMAIVLILSLAPVCVNITRDFQAHLDGTIDPVFGCEGTIGVISAPSETVIGIARTPNLENGSDMASCTGDHTASTRRVLLVLNVLHLTFSLQVTFGSSDGFGSNIVYFTEPCTAVLVSWFLLHLQEAGSRTVRVDTGDPLHMESRVSTPSFVDGRVLGSIGHRDHDYDVNSDQ